MKPVFLFVDLLEAVLELDGRGRRGLEVLAVRCEVRRRHRLRSDEVVGQSRERAVGEHVDRDAGVGLPLDGELVSEELAGDLVVAARARRGVDEPVEDLLLGRPLLRAPDEHVELAKITEGASVLRGWLNRA